MTSDLRRPKDRIAVRVDPLLHRLVAPIVAGLSLLAFVVLSIGAASLASRPARHGTAPSRSQGAGTTPRSGHMVPQGHAETPARSR